LIEELEMTDKQRKLVTSRKAGRQAAETMLEVFAQGGERSLANALALTPAMVKQIDALTLEQGVSRWEIGHKLIAGGLEASKAKARK
jgi:hypothetical protein